LNKPLVSIIIVVFNAQKTIENCIESILSQSDDYELIIIDGLSDDNTVNILEKYKDSISYFVSEKDSGIYDAMNKGIDAANGEYVYFLGSDDVFYNNEVLIKVSDLLKNNKPDLLLGDIIYDNKSIVKPRFNRMLLLHNTIHHQGTFYKRDLFKTFRYNTKYSTIADYELNLKCFLDKGNLKIFYIDKFIADCASDGLSHLRQDLFLNETNSIRSKYFNSFINYLLSFVLLAKFKMISIIK
jgi:putative colanic acid biosynthesis glycosyltransferase